MAEARSFRLGELAAAIEGEVIGDPEISVTGVRTLERAGAHDLSFVSRTAFRERAAGSRAAALLVSPDLVPPDLVSPDLAPAEGGLSPVQ